MRPLLHVVLHVLPIFLLMSSISLLVPIVSGPDEQAHYLYSAAVARGQTASLDVEVPAAIANVQQFTCLAAQPDQTGACQVPYTGPDVTTSAPTHVGLYNPVFYAWTGIGSLIEPTEDGLYLARILAGLVSATMLGWTISFLRRRGRASAPMTAVAVVWTPMATYLGGVLNPSAWEIFATIAVTVSGWALMMDDDPGTNDTARKWREGHSLLLFTGAILLVSRGLSPLIAFLALAALVICAGWSRARRALTTRPSVVVLAVLAAVGVYAVLWTKLVGTHYIGVKPPESVGQGVRAIPDYYDGALQQVQQLFGFLGWFDVQPPNFLVLVWCALVAGFLAISYSAVIPRQQLVLALSAVTVLVLPAVLQGMLWTGVGWQGRYTLPMLAALTMIAGLAAGDAAVKDARDVPDDREARQSRVAAQLRIGAAGGFALFHICMLGFASHRYVVGASRPFFSSGDWQPPVGSVALLTVAYVCIVVLAVVMGRPALGRREVQPTASPSETPVVRT